jgi:hypothetical protein
MIETETKTLPLSFFTLPGLYKKALFMGLSQKILEKMHEKSIPGYFTTFYSRGPQILAFIKYINKGKSVIVK